MMPMTRLLALLLAFGMLAAEARAEQPYAGLQARTPKSLSDQQLTDLRAGRGMGLALPAELNGYPGPMHVLELADALALTPEQRARTQELYAEMKAEAVALGERLILQETELDRAFAAGTMSYAELAAATAAIGQTQAALRLVHLRQHLAMKGLLDPGQVRRYAELRGYHGRRMHPGH